MTQNARSKKKDGKQAVCPGKRYKLTFTWEGRRIYAYGRTEAEAIVNRALKKKALEDGAKKITKQTLCREWVKIYFATYRKPVIVERSYKDEQSLWRVHIEPHIGAVALSSIRQTQCQNVLNIMAAAGRRTKHVRKAAIFMKAMFRAAIEDGVLLENPAAGIKMPACEEDGTHRQITDAERAALLAACDAIPYPHGLWARIMLYCGLRPGETSRVKWEHFDLVGKRLYIDGTKTKAARRWVPLPDALIQHIPEQNGSGSYVFTNQDGSPISKTNMKRMWAQIVKEMHIALGGETDYGNLRRIAGERKVATDFVPYNLRHTYCTDLQDAGIPINVARDFMGHTSIEMTSRIYTHMTDTAFESARKMMNQNL